MKIWEKDWDSLRFNPKTCDCGPLYSIWRVYQLEIVVEMFKNTDTHKVLDCSYPPSYWEEFVRQVNEKKRSLNLWKNKCFVIYLKFDWIFYIL